MQTFPHDGRLADESSAVTQTLGDALILLYYS